MKAQTKILKAIAVVILSNLSTYAQVKGVIWTEIPASYEFQELGHEIKTNSIEFERIATLFNVTRIFKAVPASKNEKLQRLYEIHCDCNEHELLAEMAKHHDVFINPEIGPHYETLLTPNDLTTTFPQDYALDLINAQAAWDITTGDSTIQIAISDAGFYFDHPEFQNKTTYQSSNISTINIPHGTAVAVCAAGETDNGIGKSSIGYNSSLQLYGMNYNELLLASNNGADVINASWASGCTFSTYGQNIIDEIYANGSILVCAAGNGGTCSSNHADLVYPAAFNHVISVTSTGPNDNHERIPGDSNSTHQHNAMVDICAPGYDIALSGSPTWYTYGSGTSFAAPIVSGTIGLMLAANPCLSIDEVELLLKQSADTAVLDLNPTYAWGLGAGRLNAQMAVQLAKNYSSLNASITTELNCNEGTYTMNVVSCDGTGTLNYAWSNNSSNNSPTCIVNSTYDLTITDELGCKFTTSGQFTEFSPIQIESIITSPSCYGSNDGVIEINPTGGFGFYSTTWQDGTADLFLSSLSSGVYQVSVSDGMGCVRDFDIEVLDPLKLIITLEEDLNDELINVHVDGGTAPYIYFWDNQINGATNDLMNYNAIEIVDANGCQVATSYTVAEETAGMTENEFTGALYPNPFSNNITIRNDVYRIREIKLFDINGKLVHSEEVNALFETTCDLSELNKGIYFLEIVQVNGQVLATKVIKAS